MVFRFIWDASKNADIQALPSEILNQSFQGWSQAQDCIEAKHSDDADDQTGLETTDIEDKVPGEEMEHLNLGCSITIFRGSLGTALSET